MALDSYHQDIIYTYFLQSFKAAQCNTLNPLALVTEKSVFLDLNTVMINMVCLRFWTIQSCIGVSPSESCENKHKMKRSQSWKLQVNYSICVICV